MMDRREQASPAVLDPIRSATQLDVLRPHRRVDHALDLSLVQLLDRPAQSLDHPAIITSTYDI